MVLWSSIRCQRLSDLQNIDEGQVVVYPKVFRWVLRLCINMNQILIYYLKQLFFRSVQMSNAARIFRPYSTPAYYLCLLVFSIFLALILLFRIIFLMKSSAVVLVKICIIYLLRFSFFLYIKNLLKERHLVNICLCHYRVGGFRVLRE